MKLHLLNRDNPENRSFMVTKHREPFFLKVWHYHPELELVLTIRGTGTRFVGDSIEKFDGQDVILIGKNLPHMWLNDERYFNNNSDLVAQDVVIHFKKEFLGIDFFETNEMNHISKLMHIARYGIKFLNLKKKVLSTIHKIAELGYGFERTMQFIYLLNALARHQDYELLSSEAFVNSFKKNQNKILDKTYEYIFENFSRPISLKDVAEVAHMNPSAFSRFFKRINHKTFSRYLNEVRIGYSCKLLKEHRMHIATVGYESGFNNISNFNRQFKCIMNTSPTEYRMQFNKPVEKSLFDQ